MSLSKRFRNIHCGKSIAIVGSGPSAILYSDNHDISIGVNGASKLGPHYNYYMCGDSHSFNRDWFNINCSDVRVIGNVVATMDKIIYPQSVYGNMERFFVRTLDNEKLNKIPDPIEPHFVYKYKMIYNKEISKKQEYLYAGATISGCALQLAYMMGSHDIHLYGCDFTHDNGKYFYETNANGFIRDSQLYEMKKLIDVIKKNGINISIHGDSKLNN